MQIDDPVADILCSRIYPENGFPQRRLEHHVVRDACVRRHKLLVYLSPARGTDGFAHIGSDVATKRYLDIPALQHISVCDRVVSQLYSY